MGTPARDYFSPAIEGKFEPHTKTNMQRRIRAS
jgi:hypothetical protein